MSTFADKSREQLVKARSSAPTAAGYNRLDDSHIQAEVVLRLKRKANAAVRIQQWYRSYVSIWRHYGPIAFVGRQPDQIANFGKVFFPSTGKMAMFLKPSDTSDATLLCNMARHYWKIPNPEIIIAMGGAAQNFDMAPELRQAFDVGLAQVVTFAKSTIVTGGTNTGIMKLVGETMSRVKAECPIIGIPSQGSTIDGDQFNGVFGETVTYVPSSPASDLGAPIDPNHTHFLIMDTGKEPGKSWGSEVQPMNDFKVRLAKLTGAVIINLILGGGPQTLKLISSALESKTAVVLVVGTGQACDAIFEYKINGEVEMAKHFPKPPEARDDQWEARLDQSKDVIVEIMRRNNQSGNRLLHFFELDTDKAAASELETDKAAASEGLAGKLLAALVASLSAAEAEDPAKSQSVDAGGAWFKTRTLNVETGLLRSNVEKCLRLAIRWSRIDVVEKLLKEHPKMRTSSGYTDLRQMALQYALELQRDKVLAFLFKDPELDVGLVDMKRLFIEGQQHDQVRYLSSATVLTKTFEEGMKQKIHDDTSSDGLSLKEQYDLHVKALTRLLEAKLPKIRAYYTFMKSAGGHLHEGAAQLPTFSDIFMWAVFMGNLPVAELAWAKANQPVRHAMLGAAILRHMSKKVSWGGDALRESADKMEKWAVGVLDEVTDRASAEIILTVQRPDTLLDMAMFTASRSFLANPKSQALTTLIWSGGFASSAVTLPADFSHTSLALQALSPAKLLPTLRRQVLGDGSADDETPFKELLEMASVRLGLTFTSQLRRLQETQEPGAPRAPYNSERHKNIASLQRQSTLYLTHQRRSMQSGFYSVPAVKYTMEVMSYLIFVLLYVSVLVDLATGTERADASVAGPVLGFPARLGAPSPPISTKEGVFLLWTLGVALHELKLFRTLSRLKLSADVPFASLFGAANMLLLLGVCARLLSWMAAYLLVLSVCIIVVAGRMVMLRCTTSPSIGTLVIMVREMGTDLAIFIELLTMIVCGFSFALVGLAAMKAQEGELGLLGFVADGGSAEGADGEGGAGATAAAASAHRMLKLKTRSSSSGANSEEHKMLDREWYASTSPFMVPVWAVLGNMDVEIIEESIMFGAPLMWIYTLIATVVLVNLLVAMFSETYSRIKENSETEYCHLRYVFVYSYRHLTDPIPPPLNLPVSLWQLGRDLLGISDVGTGDASQPVPEEPHHWSRVIDQDWSGQDSSPGTNDPSKETSAPNHMDHGSPQQQAYKRANIHDTRSTTQASFRGGLKAQVSLTEAYMQRFLETKRQSSNRQSGSD